PVFTNILLADEINRTPPRTQSALLEAMQEHQVTAGRRRFPLPAPFFVLATQNPIEQEGTYPLPEAQLDRFMFKSRVTYPTRQDELDILLQTTGTRRTEIEPVLTREELLDAMDLVRRVPVSGPVAEYALDICRATRPECEESAVGDPIRTDPGAKVGAGTKAGFGSRSGSGARTKTATELQAYIREYTAWGAGPRAGQALLLGARARAVLHGRLTVEREDIRVLAYPVLRHRIQTRFSADARGVTPDQIIEKIVTFLEISEKV
ncbi:MAG: AAA family ATPase, partial [Thermoguttaceae bacterium]|nr:AAA family ATPase [Thermoguttaceae bacterium]